MYAGVKAQFIAEAAINPAEFSYLKPSKTTTKACCMWFFVALLPRFSMVIHRVPKAHRQSLWCASGLFRTAVLFDVGGYPTEYIVDRD